MNGLVENEPLDIKQHTCFHDIKLEIEWRVDRFDRLLQLYPTGENLLGSEVKSPCVPHIAWQIRLYPNGHANDNANQTGIFLYWHRPKRDGSIKLNASLSIHLIAETGEKKTLSVQKNNFGTRDSGIWTSHTEVKSSMHADGSLLILAELEFVYQISDDEEMVPAPNNSFAELLEEGTNSDCTIKLSRKSHHGPCRGGKTYRFQVGREEVKAHKGILSARSAIFKAMFSNEAYREAADGIVVIDDFSFQSVKAMLQFFYSGAVASSLPLTQVREIFEIADKYQATTLKDEMGRRLSAQMSGGNFFHTLTLADTYSCQSIKKACANYLRNHLDLITRKVEWKKLKSTRGELTTELLEMSYGVENNQLSASNGTARGSATAKKRKLGS